MYLYCHFFSPDLHAFPTRRSSDLPTEAGAEPQAGRFFEHDRYAGGDVRKPGTDRNLALYERLPKPALIADRKSTRLNSSHVSISYAVFCLKKQKITEKLEIRSRLN